MADAASAPLVPTAPESGYAAREWAIVARMPLRGEASLLRARLDRPKARALRLSAARVFAKAPQNLARLKLKE
jgi:hypothetical protein